MGQPSNAAMAKVNARKEAVIPFTILTSAAIGTLAASIDGEFAGNAEIFVASALGAAQPPSRFGNGGAATSALDPSATPKTLSANTGPLSLGFVILDGPSEKQPATLPLVGDGKNPSYGTPAPRGDAKQVYSAVVTITDGSGTSIQPGTAAVAARADVEITPNGNINLRVTFPSWMPSGAATNTAPTMVVGGQTIKGFLEIEWF